jgi:hypothetical protein
VNVTDSALIELEGATTFSQRAELCVWGRETRRLRDWELSLLAIRNPERFIYVHPDETERFSAAAKKLRADCELCLVKQLAEACEGDGDEFKDFCEAMKEAYLEHRKRDPWKPLKNQQLESFEKWINEHPRAGNEQQRRSLKNERKSAINRARLRTKMDEGLFVLWCGENALERVRAKIKSKQKDENRIRNYVFRGARRYARRRQRFRLQGMNALSEQSLAWARHNALEALHLVNVSTHPVHAGVLMFSRKFTHDEKYSMSEHSRREIAKTDGSAPGLPLRLERMGIKVSCSVFEMFEGNTTQEAMTASALSGRLQELLGRGVSPGDVREAAELLGIGLKLSSSGAKRGRKPAPRRGARN